MILTLKNLSSKTDLGVPSETLFQINKQNRYYSDDIDRVHIPISKTEQPVNI